MKQSLNWNWNFVENYEDSYLEKFPKNSSKINIPHTVKEVPYNCFSEEIYQFISTYEKVFDVENLTRIEDISLSLKVLCLKPKFTLTE